jgi:hypothetical protein
MDMIGEESDETILACDVSDEALEAAGSPTRDGAQAMSFPNAPTSRRTISLRFTPAQFEADVCFRTTVNLGRG